MCHNGTEKVSFPTYKAHFLVMHLLSTVCTHDVFTQHITDEHHP